MRQAVWLAAAVACGGTAAQAGSAVLDAAALFPEGPRFVGEDLLYAEYAGNTISRIDAEGVKSTLWTSEGCGPSAVVPFGETLLVTCYDAGSLVAIAPDGATAATWTTDAGGAPLVGPNDIAPDGAGGVWVTASGPWESGPIVGKVYHLAPDGVPTLAADDLHYANGIAVAPDGGRLYVAESEAGRIISFAIGEDGTLSDRRLFVRLAVVDPDSGVGAYPDGMEFSPDGTLWIGQYSSGRILAVAPDGSLSTVVEVPAPAAPNLAFTPDGADLVVTAVDDPSAAPYPGTVHRVALP